MLSHTSLHEENRTCPLKSVCHCCANTTRNQISARMTKDETMNCDHVSVTTKYSVKNTSGKPGHSKEYNFSVLFIFLFFLYFFFSLFYFSCFYFLFHSLCFSLLSVQRSLLSNAGLFHICLARSLPSRHTLTHGQLMQASGCNTGKSSARYPQPVKTAATFFLALQKLRRGYSLDILWKLLLACFLDFGIIQLLPTNLMT